MINFLKDQFSTIGFKNWLIAYFLALISLYSSFFGYLFVFLLFYDVVRTGLIAEGKIPDTTPSNFHMNFWFDLIFGGGLVLLFCLNNYYLLAGSCALSTISDLTRNNRKIHESK
jgi:hypothetical protein